MMRDDTAQRLLALLQERFSRQELEQLLFSLHIDHESLTAPETSRDKLAQEAVRYCSRRQRLAELQAAMLAAQPDLAALLGQSAVPSPPPTAAIIPPSRHWWLWGMGGILLLTLLIATGLIFLTPTAPFNLTITVQDTQTQTPLTNAQIILTAGGDYAPFVAYSDTEGFARLTNLPSELLNQPAQLEVRQTGYEPYQRNLTLDSGTITVRLTPVP